MFSSLAIQIAGVVFAAVKSGNWLDVYFDTQSNLWALILSGIGIILVLVLIQKQSKNLNEN